MARHTLTATRIAALKETGKAVRLSDGAGLYLYVTPAGIKTWQFRYRYSGKQQTASLGKFPAVSLAEAREKAEKARALVANGEHLTRAKHVANAQKAAMASATFAKVAEDWVADESQRKRWTADYRADVEASLRNHLHKLNNLPVGAITAAICSPILRGCERATPDTASKVRQRLRGILDYAVEHGIITINPIPTPRNRTKKEVRHLPAILTPEGVGQILRAANKAECCKGVQRAHLICAFTAQRISEVVSATWIEVDLTTGTWTIPRHRMKRKNAAIGPHLVPIPPSLLAKLKEWKRDDGSSARWICPAPRGEGHITREAVEKFYSRTLALATLHSPHSWRSVFSTWSYEAGNPTDIVEAQLDHAVGNSVQQAYDRSNRLELRRALIASHETKLISARDDTTPVNIRSNAT